MALHRATAATRVFDLLAAPASTMVHSRPAMTPPWIRSAAVTAVMLKLDTEALARGLDPPLGAALDAAVTALNAHSARPAMARAMVHALLSAKLVRRQSAEPAMGARLLARWMHGLSRPERAQLVQGFSRETREAVAAAAPTVAALDPDAQRLVTRVMTQAHGLRGALPSASELSELLGSVMGLGALNAPSLRALERWLRATDRARSLAALGQTL